MQPVIYRRRRSAISRGEREWRVEKTGLATCGDLGRERRLAWSEIASVRLACAPKSGQPWRHVFEIQPRHGPKIIIDNSHFAGPGAFENRSATYTPFVRAAAAQLASANPKARAMIGETPLHYFLLLLTALFALGGLAFTLIAVHTPLDNLPFAPLIKLGILLAMLPIFARWIVGGVPHGVALDAIPPRALPPVEETGEMHAHDAHEMAPPAD